MHTYTHATITHVTQRSTAHKCSHMYSTANKQISRHMHEHCRLHMRAQTCTPPVRRANCSSKARRCRRSSCHRSRLQPRAEAATLMLSGVIAHSSSTPNGGWPYAGERQFLRMCMLWKLRGEPEAYACVKSTMPPCSDGPSHHSKRGQHLPGVCANLCLLGQAS